MGHDHLVLGKMVSFMLICASSLEICFQKCLITMPRVVAKILPGSNPKFFFIEFQIVRFLLLETTS